MDKFDFYDTEYDYLTDYIFNNNNYNAMQIQLYHPLGLRYGSGRRPNCVEECCFEFSNERLQEYMPKLNLESKRVATVGSSGDQLLNAIYYGAKNITLVDGNPYSRAYIEYKIALIRNLCFDDFNEVYILDNHELFNYKTYSRISHDLSIPVRQFWDKIILEQPNSIDVHAPSAYKIFNALMTYGIMEFSGDFYRCENQYNQLQAKLLQNNYNIDYVYSEFDEFANNLEGTFDAIILSNIYDYVDDEEFATHVRKLYDTKLNPGGKIQAQYELVGKAGETLVENLSDLDFEKFDATGDFVWIINKPNLMEQSVSELTM